MKISIIIPCYNLEKYIEKCLRSIDKQDFDKTEYEVLIVFDSCTDSSKQVALKFLNGKRINYKLFETNYRRAGLSRNVGLQNSEGKYVYFIDGDDYLITDNALTKLVNAIEINKTSVVYQKNFESEQFVYDVDAVWRYFFDRAFIGEERFSSLEINEDWEFIMNIKQKKNYSESFVEDVLYHYTYPRENSITDKFRKIHSEIFKN